MNKHSSLRAESLLERAAEIYDFGADLRRRPAVTPASGTVSDEWVEPEAAATPEPSPPQPIMPTRGGQAKVDRENLRALGFIVPEAPVGGLAEEFRIVKRQLLAAMKGDAGLPEDKRRTILISSAQPGEGKTYCAINLALSLAAERDVEVLLVDGDFNKPEIFTLLGLKAGAGLIDAIADSRAESATDVERYVVSTDIPGLSLLAPGRAANNATELLASDRTRAVLSALVGNRPRRIILFDSPPALMASPAAVLATHVGQLVMVVRADQTTETDLREATTLLSGCDTISLLLNGEAFVASGRRFGSYYGYGQ